MTNIYPANRKTATETPEQRAARLAQSVPQMQAAIKEKRKATRGTNLSVAQRKIEKAKAANLSEEDQIELYLLESTSLINEVLKRTRKYMKETKDPGELSRIALNLLEIQDKLKGNRTAGRAREIKKTTQEIAESNDMAALIQAAVAKTPSDLAEIVVDKQQETPQT